MNTIIMIIWIKDKIKENNKIKEEKNNENNSEKTITLNISNLNLIEENILVKHKNVTDINFSNNIIENDCSGISFNNSFDIYESEDKETNIVYSNKNKIIIFNLDKNTIEKEIEDSHKTNIFGFKTYFDKKNNKKLIMSMSFDNNIRIWNIENWKCIQNIENINENGLLYSACFLNDNNNLYIITSNIENKFGFIKLFDMEGNKIKEIKDSKNYIYYLETFYDNNNSQIFIIAAFINYFESYKYSKNEIIQYKKYELLDNNNISLDSIQDQEDIITNKNNMKFRSFKIISEDKNLRLLGALGEQQMIGIWDFYTGEFKDQIEIQNSISIRGICLWEKNYILVWCEDLTIKIVDLNKKKIMKSLEGHTNKINYIKKIYNKNYGECLISQSLDNTIKLWK